MEIKKSPYKEYFGLLCVCRDWETDYIFCKSLSCQPPPQKIKKQQILKYQRLLHEIEKSVNMKIRILSSVSKYFYQIYDLTLQNPDYFRSNTLFSNTSISFNRTNWCHFLFNSIFVEIQIDSNISTMTAILSVEVS